MVVSTGAGADRREDRRQRTGPTKTIKAETEAHNDEGLPDSPVDRVARSLGEALIGGRSRAMIDDDEEAALWSRRNTPVEHPIRRAYDRVAAALREKRSNERLARECLDHYNALHPGDEHEHDLAPGGDVTLSRSHCSTGAWTHGNFVARRRRRQWRRCLAFVLPATRTLFFFEHMSGDDYLGVITCIPMPDEPVGGFLARIPLIRRWATPRRSGRWDCVCKTCRRGLRVTHHWLKRKVVGEFPCGHMVAESVCKMCYHYSDVVHPSPGKFARGYLEHEDEFGHYGRNGLRDYPC
uniref:DUF3615 domain-containing protein n=1 Tax=Oryza glumipatula TaxID=40148 RepID=A0A0E0A1T0_9ORYZ